MTRATIILEDVNGSVNMVMQFEGGVNAQSNAHNCALALSKHMETLGQRQGEAETKTVGGDDLQLAEPQPRILLAH